ncbi:MAG: hypothetical protein KJZ64_05165 [Sphingomonadaceae bacterium]|nr:hypothetical protein [Sphingomonadaceae bacterium]
MRVAVILTGKAYLPEAWAYQHHLEHAGHKAWLADSVEGAAGADLAICFSLGQQRELHRMGLSAVHEYHSLSAGWLRHGKDLIKRLAAPPAAGRIFSEPHIEQRLRFAPDCPHLLRPMGFDAAIAGCTAAASASHDIVYCGSTSRSGVVDTLEALANAGWKVIVFGKLDDANSRARLHHAGVEIAGAIGRHDVPAALATARFGLNVTPDVAPFNRQASVKTLEYAAAGLGIIANRYAWIEDFAERHGIAVHWLDDVLAQGRTAPDRLEPAPVDLARIAYLEWECLLGRVGFSAFLQRCLAQAGGAGR